MGPSIKDVSTEGEGGGLEGSETISPLRVIKPKAMKNDKGREGGGVIKSRKWASVVYGWALAVNNILLPLT